MRKANLKRMGKRCRQGRETKLICGKMHWHVPCKRCLELIWTQCPEMSMCFDCVRGRPDLGVGRDVGVVGDDCDA